MKAIDTNVLVRFLVNDDKAQAQQVRTLLKTAEQQRAAYFVPLLVVLETIWVLESAYQIQRDDLLDALGDLLLMPVLQFEQREAVRKMVLYARDNAVDLSDALIAQSTRAQGCEAILTFDKKAARGDGFAPLRNEI